MSHHRSDVHYVYVFRLHIPLVQNVPLRLKQLLPYKQYLFPFLHPQILPRTGGICRLLGILTWFTTHAQHLTAIPIRLHSVLCALPYISLFLILNKSDMLKISRFFNIFCSPYHNFGDKKCPLYFYNLSQSLKALY